MTPTLQQFFQKVQWFMPYKAFSYFHPTRIENAVSHLELNTYDVGEWLAQVKLNGNSCLVFTNGIELHVYDRHGKQFSKQNIPLHEKNGAFRALYSETLVDGKHENKWMVLVGEYMLKSKLDEEGNNWNNNYVIFDILAYDGYQLLKSTFAERQIFLDYLFGVQEAEGNKAEIMYSTNVPGVYRVKTFTGNFVELYQKWSAVDMIEGLVLKQTDAGLMPLVGEKNNMLSQLKFRKPTKNYHY